MKTSYIFAIASLFIFSFSCRKDEQKTCPSRNNCSHMFESLTLVVKNQNGQPVFLDKIVSKRSNGSVFEFFTEQPVAHDTTLHYVFWSDSQINFTKREGETITVKGYKDNNEVFTTSFVVGHDCCHVQVLEGNENIVVQ